MIFFNPYLTAATFIGLFLFGIIYRRVCGVCTSTKKLNGKTVIVTGGSAGIGKEAAKDLAGRGARVILACIDLENAEKVKAWIISNTKNQNVVVRHLDVSDFDSVRKFSKEILDQEERIDVLINNAGVGLYTRQESKDGFELTGVTNHSGHFLLTNLLLGLIRKSAPSRIINVSSMLHKGCHVDFDDFHFRRRKYSFLSSYGQSKLCNILFTNELAHLMSGKGVTVNSLHPGVVATEFVTTKGSFLGTLFALIILVIGKTAKMGAQTTIHLAASDEVSKVTGEYFVDCQVAESSKESQDPGLAKKLWEFSEDEVQLKEEERHYLN